MKDIYYLDLLDKTWEEVGRCYGLTRELYKRGGVLLPDYYQPDQLEEIHKLIAREERLLLVSGKIEKLDKPEPWCLVVIQWIGQKAHSHICVVLKDCKSFLHVTGRKGVVIEKINRVDRWGTIRGYYKWIE